MPLTREVRDWQKPLSQCITLTSIVSFLVVRNFFIKTGLAAGAPCDDPLQALLHAPHVGLQTGELG